MKLLNDGSEAESFTLFENHVYSHYKILMFPHVSIFCLTFHATYNSYWVN